MSALAERTLSVWRGEVRPRVRIGGDGPPLLYLHGEIGLRWDHFLDALAERYTVYAPEHPGTSPGDPDGIKAVDNLWDLVLAYYELLDELELERIPIVGHSFGGMVAAELAATNPERVSKLVLLCPLGLWRDDAPVRNWMILRPDELPEIAFSEPTGPVATELLAMPEGDSERAEATIERQWALACTGKFLWPIPDKGLRKRLHRIAAPTLVVWGADDKLAPPVYAQEFAERIPNARAEVVERAAHVPQLEQLETVSRLVRDFLGE